VKPGRIDQLTEHVDLGPALLNLLNAPPFVVQHGQDLSMHLRGSSPKRGRSEVVSEYLENEEVFVRTKRWKLIYCSGRRVRLDGYETDNPTPGRSIRLFDLQNDPDEYTDVASRNPHVVNELKEVALTRFRQTHPDAGREPSRTDVDDLLDFYVRPRDPDPPEARSPR
jgi:choline-sulfatase